MSKAINGLSAAGAAAKGFFGALEAGTSSAYIKLMAFIVEIGIIIGLILFLAGKTEEVKSTITSIGDTARGAAEGETVQYPIAKSVPQYARGTSTILVGLHSWVNMGRRL